MENQNQEWCIEKYKETEKETSLYEKKGEHKNTLMIKHECH